MEVVIIECKHTETAKGDRMCELCGTTIKAGTPFSREVIKYYGVHYDRKLHSVCNVILESFCQENGTENFRYEWVQKWLEEKHCNVCELYSKCEIANKARCKYIVNSYEARNNK